MRGLLGCLILISQVKDCFGVFSAGSLGPTKYKLLVCQCKLKALFISSNPCSFQHWGVQVCIYTSTKMLWLWLDLIGVMQSFGTIFCKVPRLVTVESVSLDSQRDSALSHRSPSHFLFLSSRALGAFSSSYSSYFGGTQSPARGFTWQEREVAQPKPRAALLPWFEMIGETTKEKIERLKEEKTWKAQFCLYL